MWEERQTDTCRKGVWLEYQYLSPWNMILRTIKASVTD